MKRALVAAVVALSGCVSPQPETTPMPQRIIPYSGGLKIADSAGQEISFGRVQLGVEVAMNRLVGATPNETAMTAQGCQIKGWKNGLKLVFDKGDFVGWIAGAPVWQTPEGSAGNTCGWTL